MVVVTGLEWSDIDFEKSSISVNKSTQYVSGIGVLEKETKNESSDRTIYASTSTMKLLGEYCKEQLENRLRLGSKWQGSSRVFTTIDGADMHPNTPFAILTRVLKRHNLTYINFHGLSIHLYHFKLQVVFKLRLYLKGQAIVILQLHILYIHTSLKMK